jgi:hypothetical protein
MGCFWTTGIILGVVFRTAKKERFMSYKPQQVLKSIATMRVGIWNYKGDDGPGGPSQEHNGSAFLPPFWNR